MTSPTAARLFLPSIFEFNGVAFVVVAATSVAAAAVRDVVAARRVMVETFVCVSIDLGHPIPFATIH